MKRGRLGRYSVWQARDFVLERGVAVLIIGLLLGYMAYLAIKPMRAMLGPDWTTKAGAPFTQIIDSMLSQVIALAVLIAVNGIVSNDRHLGYFRFLFAKPVNRVSYYAQLFTVHLAGVLVMMSILMGVFWLGVAPIPVLPILFYTLVVYMAMGGIGFFISTATRHDWVVLTGVWLGSRVIRVLYSDKPDLRAKLVQVLPPVHRIDDVANHLLVGQMAATSDVVWLVGYGAVFFVLGLYVIHRRSLID